MRKPLIILVYVLILNPVVFAETVVVMWRAPTHNEDGSRLTDLAGYQVYYAVDGNPTGPRS